MAFSDQWEAAAERDDEKKSRWDNVKAEVEYTARKLKQTRDDRDKRSQDQFTLAATEKPSRFRTQLQRVRYEGATARKDADDGVRERWLHILCGIVANTNTPMEQMVSDKLGSFQLLAAGRGPQR